MARTDPDDHLDDHDAVQYFKLDCTVTILFTFLSRTHLLGWLCLVSLDRATGTQIFK